MLLTVQYLFSNHSYASMFNGLEIQASPTLHFWFINKIKKLSISPSENQIVKSIKRRIPARLHQTRSSNFRQIVCIIIYYHSIGVNSVSLEGANRKLVAPLLK